MFVPWTVHPRKRRLWPGRRPVFRRGRWTDFRAAARRSGGRGAGGHRSHEARTSPHTGLHVQHHYIWYHFCMHLYCYQRCCCCCCCCYMMMRMNDGSCSCYCYCTTFLNCNSSFCPLNLLQLSTDWCPVCTHARLTDYGLGSVMYDRFWGVIDLGWRFVGSARTTLSTVGGGILWFTGCDTLKENGQPGRRHRSWKLTGCMRLALRYGRKHAK